MNPRRLSDLDARERRREIARATLVILVAWISLGVVYYLLPLDGGSRATTLLRLGLAIAVFVIAIAWQTRRIVNADLPELRAIRALGVLIPLFLSLISSVYLSLSHASTSHFSEPLDHTDALYFTITVFSSVGFGDIDPIGRLARVCVSVQMLLDLVIFGTLVRLLTRVTKSALATPQPDDARSSRSGQ